MIRTGKKVSHWLEVSQSCGDRFGWEWEGGGGAVKTNGIYSEERNAMILTASGLLTDGEGETRVCKLTQWVEGSNKRLCV